MHNLRALVWLLFLIASVAATSVAGAASLTTVLEPFTGYPVAVRVTLDDDQDDGSVRISAEVLGDAIADLRGIFLNITDQALLSGLEITGASVSSTSLSGSVIDLGSGSNLNGGGSPCPCDIGVEIGSPGIGKDDIRSTFFSLTHESEALTLALFSQQPVGVRVTSVGFIDGEILEDREGSSKLHGVVPEPGTAVLLGLGLTGMAVRRRGRTLP